jgi:siroheme synthase
MFAFQQNSGQQGEPARSESVIHADERARSAMGSATLVGAGPGDPELLTLRAVQAIQRADAVLFDTLIDPSILNLARPDVRRGRGECTASERGAYSCYAGHRGGPAGGRSAKRPDAGADRRGRGVVAGDRKTRTSCYMTGCQSRSVTLRIVQRTIKDGMCGAQ